jgi:endonuclease/exonuclease/phosphatase family metal-dependent hydrolase
MSRRWITARRLGRAGVVAALVSLAFPAGSGAATGAAGAVTPLAADVTSGSFSVMTYNVAGLPEIISSGNPAENTTTIGARISAYDIVNVQEDFNYHADLYSTNTHPHRTPTSGGVPFGDGLNTLSNFPFVDLTRTKWSTCNGTDCLTPKGFSLVRVRLAEGVYVDLYNLHPNASVTDADLAARRANITQIAQSIATTSAGNAVIVMGDTNTRYTRSGDNIRELLATAGLTDAWVSHVRGGTPPPAGGEALVCDDVNVTNDCEVVDKILFRGNRFVNLSLTSFSNENAKFRTADDKMLSDHYPIAARFSWTLAGGLRMSDQFGGPHGTAFTDVGAVAIGGRVAAVSIRTGARVDRVQLARADGVTFAHGGTGGSAKTLTLGAGEYITKVAMSSGKKDGHTRLFSIAFTTNLGRTVSGGTTTSDAVTYTAPAGWQIAGFAGRSGTEVDRLGMIYTPAP